MLNKHGGRRGSQTCCWLGPVLILVFSSDENFLKMCFLLCSSSKVLIGGEIESLLIHLFFPLIIQICWQISDSHLVCLCSFWSRPLSFLTPHLPLSASSFEANLPGVGRLTYMISVIILFLGSQLCISGFSSQSFCKSIKLLT